MAIPYTVTRSVVFFIASTLLLCSAYSCCLMGHCVRNRTLCTFVSGVIFIVTGLVMLFGLIVYISVLKAEVGGKLRPRSHVQPPAFRYSYGYSFLLYVGGLVGAHLSGVCCVFLFVRRMQRHYRRQRAADMRRDKRPPPPGTGPPPPPFLPHLDHSAFYPCRRHPHAYVNSNSAVHFDHVAVVGGMGGGGGGSGGAGGVGGGGIGGSVAAKRYFFSKEPLHESPCSVHRARSQANSLRDVSSYYDFPPPPAISYQFDDAFDAFEVARRFPRDATTNTVSTTADVNCDDFLLNGAATDLEDFSPPGRDADLVTFDLDQPLPLRPAHSTLSISSRNGRKAAAAAGSVGGVFDSDTLRRTTPV